MNYFLVASTVMAILTPIIGIRAVLRGQFKPQRTTRLIILLLTFLFVGTLFAQGDRNGIFIAIVQLLSSLALFGLSLKHGMGGTSKIDITVLVAALLTIFIWRTTHNPTLALCLSILADLIGLIPTLIKSWFLPSTEDWKFYLSDVFAGLFSILSIAGLSFENLIFPLYIFIINLTSVLIIVLRRKSLGQSI